MSRAFADFEMMRVSVKRLAFSAVCSALLLASVSCKPLFKGADNPTKTLNSSSDAAASGAVDASLTISFGSTVPASPSSSNTAPVIKGSAATASDMIILYSDSSCSQELIRTTRAAFQSSGVSAAVSANSTTSIYGVASIAATQAKGPCTLLTEYVHDSTGPSITFGTSSRSRANSTHTVTYAVNFVGAASVSLVSGDITLNKTATADCSYAISGSGTSTRTVTLSSCTGNGTVGFTLAGTVQDAAGNLLSGSATSPTFVVDNTVPLVSVSAPSSSLVSSSSTFTFTVSYTDASSITLSASGVTLNQTGNVSCTKAVSGTDSGVRTVTLSSCSGSGTVGVTIAAGTAVNSTGTLATASSASSVATMDNTAPTVSSVTSSTANGSYKEGQSVSIQVAFSESVFVTSGTPTLTLSTVSNAVVNYVSGSGTGTLTFTYTIGSGQTASDLDYASTSSLVLAGATIKDSAGNNATLTLAAPGAANSLAANKAIVIDTTAPSAPTALVFNPNSTYSTSTGLSTNWTVSAASDVISQSLNIYKTSNCTGTELTGSPFSFANNTTATQVFTGVNGTTYSFLVTATDVAGNATTSSCSSGITVDSTGPSITNTTASTADGSYRVGGSISIQVTFNEAVTVTGVPTLALNSGGTATFASASGATLTFAYTVGGGDSASDLEYSSTVALSLAGGTIKDSAGNDATLTLLALATPGPLGSLGGNKSIVIDNAGPSLTINQGGSQADQTNSPSISFDVVFSEAINVSTFTVADITQSGTATGVTFSVTDSGDHINFTVATTAISADGTVIPSIAANTVTDVVGNGNASSTSTDHTVTYDTAVPTLAITGPSPATVNSAGSGVFTVTYTGASSTTLVAANVSITGTGASCSGKVVAGSGSSYTVTLSTCTGDGNLGITIAANTAADSAGNQSATASSGNTLTVNNSGPAPTVTSVSPSLGALAGTGTLTLTGTGFLASPTITVGGTTCTSPTYVSATSATCVLPAKSAGSYDVVLTNSDTQAGTLATGYTYSAGSNMVLNVTSTTSTARSGYLYDSGGSGGNYSASETTGFKIQPTGASSVTITFSSVGTESNYDFVKVYNGTSTAGTLLSSSSGTTNPGTLTATSGSMYIHFTSDGSIQGTGFAATWSSTLPSAPGAFTITSATNGDSKSILTWGAASGATTYTVKYGTSSGSYPTTVSTTATSPLTVTGLTNATQYYFMVTAVNVTGSTNATAEATATPVPTTPSGTTCTTLAAANWNASAGNWDCGHIPTSGDNVVINHDTVIPAGYTIDSLWNLTINAAKTLTQSNALYQSVAGTLTVSGILTHTANTTTAAGLTYALNFGAAAMSIPSGGAINVDYKGYAGGAGGANGNGPALGNYSGASGYGGGAGHGGNGGAGNHATATGGTANCDISNPATIGSGGAGGSSTGGAGGGLINLNVTGTFTLNGTISAKGGNGTNYAAGGGAGGGLKLVADTFAGSPAVGAISLIGGTGDSTQGGSGGGGCALLQYTSTNAIGTTNLTLNAGAAGFGKGGAGVTVIRQGASGGTLFVTNAANSGAGSPQAATSLTVDYVNITGAGIYQVGSGKTLTLNQAAPFTGAGGSGSLQINGGTLSTPSTFTVNASETLIFHRASTWTNLAATSITLSSGTLDLRDYTTVLSFAPSSLTIAASGILTHGANSTTGAGQVHVVNVAAGTLNVQASGTINVDYKGYSGGAGGANGNGPALGNYSSGSGYGGGAGHGGSGGVGNHATATGGTANCDISNPATIGSGGAGGSSTGGAGAGLIILNVTGTFTLNGTISAKGGNGTNYAAGGGAGGGLKLVADTIAGSPAAGAISLIGGTGDSSQGGSGGGGCALLQYTTSNTIVTTNLTLNSGTAGFGKGGAGVALIRQGASGGTLFATNSSNAGANTTQTAASLTVDYINMTGLAVYVVGSGKSLTINNSSGFSGSGGGTLEINGGTLTTPVDFTVSASETLIFHQASTWTNLANVNVTLSSGTLDLRDYTTALSFASLRLIIASGGILTHGANTTAQTHVANISVSTMDVQTGGAINIDYKGYSGGAGGVNGNGPAKGNYSSASGYGGGAGHGGNGGAGNYATATGGTANCDISNPGTLGSGGAGGSSTGGNGGGLAIINVSGTFTLNGTISAKGGNGTNYAAGGGAGGGLKLVADTFAGSPAVGAISLIGGTGDSTQGGSGGGGCALIQYTTTNTIGTTHLTLNAGAAGFGKGGAGAAVIRQGASGGTLYATNAGNSGTVSPQTATSLTVDYVNITGAAVYQVGTGKTITLNQTAAFTGAGGSGSLEIMGTGTLATPVDFTVSASETLIFHQTATWTNLANVNVTLSSGTLDLRDYTTALAFTSLRMIIASGGILTHGANTTAQTHVANVSVSTMDVQTGGAINIDYKGYSGGAGGVSGNGPAKGNYSSASGYGGGAGHGGNGGAGNYATATGGTANCDISNPATLGSGGSGGSSTGGAGGGLAIINVSGTFTLNGTISAKGRNGNNFAAGGGAGGGLKVTANDFAGTPSASAITLTGGTGDSGQGGGGGAGCARLAFATTSTPLTTGNIVVTGGTGYAAGATGLRAVVP